MQIKMFSISGREIENDLCQAQHTYLRKWFLTILTVFVRVD